MGTFEDHQDLYLMHYGVGHDKGGHSGRYPWGSGDIPYQRYGDFYSRYKNLKAEGKTEKEIAQALNVLDKYGNPSVKKLRAMYSNAGAEKRAVDRSIAVKLMEECNGNRSEVARRMGINESTVRSLLDENKAARKDATRQTAEALKAYVDEHKYVDIGPGAEFGLGVKRTKFQNAVDILEEDGYKVQYIQIDQMGTNHKTTISVLTPGDVPYSELSENRYDIAPLSGTRTVDDEGTVTKLGLADKPVAISSDRVQIKYAEEGGLDRDGLIELRRGVNDISIGNSQYAQVRINVDDTHYLKGMAIYSDDLPDGVDIRFNTNKSLGTDKMKVLKPLKHVNADDPNSPVDWDNPFGASIETQKTYKDANGETKYSAANIIREEGEWASWSKNLASQFLSKQPLPLAKRQLETAYEDKRVEFEEICKLTNPTIKKKLLESFADGCDAQAVDLKAAPFPRQQSHVLLPFTDVKEGEIYAPNYENGTKVALVRYPHGGTFEIPILTVNNRKGSQADEAIHNAPDAVGINHSTAQRLSGADFDGDTAVVIPLSDKVNVKNSKPLKGLEDFDPSSAYPGYPGMKVISNQTKQIEMGKVTNLITDMTLKGATEEELARAVKHSMVVIDSEKHKLNYKLSEQENGIAELKKKYQDNGDGKTAASTIISRASSQQDVPVRKEWSPSSSSIGPNGEKIYQYTNETYTIGKLKGVSKKDGGEVSVNRDPKSGRLYYLQKDESTGKKVRVYTTEDAFDSLTTKTRTQRSTKMAEREDAFELTSGGSKENPGYPMEKVYATYANNMKGLGNKARLEWLKTPNLEYSKEAHEKYKEEAASLDRKLDTALMNAPRERQAQLIANQTMSLKRQDNPNMTKEQEKKYKGQALNGARKKVGASKERIDISDREWEAIQAGAISESKLRRILDNTDLDKLKERATPRQTKTISSSMQALAKSMASSGYSTADIANRLGISASSVYNITK